MLETPRLILETWQSADWLALRSPATDAEVMRYITGGTPWSDEKIQDFVNAQIKTYAERGFCRWKLIEKSSREFIGFCGAGSWRDSPDVEIGWWLAPSRWGQGLPSEGARVALRDIFERVQLDRVISVAMPANAASIRIMQKLGLKFDGPFEHTGVSLVRYSMDRADYVRLAQK